MSFFGICDIVTRVTAFCIGLFPRVKCLWGVGFFDLSPENIVLFYTKTSPFGPTCHRWANSAMCSERPNAAMNKRARAAGPRDDALSILRRLRRKAAFDDIVAERAAAVEADRLFACIFGHRCEPGFVLQRRQHSAL